MAPPSLLPSSPSMPTTLSPSSAKRVLIALQDRVDDLLENNRNQCSTEMCNEGGCDRAKRLKEDSVLLMRGFDSVAVSLSRLRSDLDNALTGARELAKPPTLTDILESQCSEGDRQTKRVVKSGEVKEEDEEKRGMKRKLELHNSSTDEDGHLPDKENDHNQVNDKLKKAKSMAVSMATKAVEMARELKSMKQDFFFMKERCKVLEEDNQRLRDGIEKGIVPEEDDLVRLQLEALLAEKSRLAYENSNLTRENQCLRQLVEYHQFTSLDLSASYDNLLEGIDLDFSSPSATTEDEEDNVIDGSSQELDPSNTRTHRSGILDL